MTTVHGMGASWSRPGRAGVDVPLKPSHTVSVHHLTTRLCMAPHFHLRCLGEPSLSDGSGLPIRFRVRKHLALVLYLMLERRRKASRERLRRLLWPSGKASQSLSQALNEIRASLGDEALDVGTHAVGLAADVLVQVDVHELRHASAPRLLEALVGHHLPDALLEGMEFGDAEEWNDWLWATRRELTAGVVGRAVEEFAKYPFIPGSALLEQAQNWAIRVPSDTFDTYALTTTKRLLSTAFEFFGERRDHTPDDPAERGRPLSRRERARDSARAISVEDGALRKVIDTIAQSHRTIVEVSLRDGMNLSAGAGRRAILAALSNTQRKIVYANAAVGGSNGKAIDIQELARQCLALRGVAACEPETYRRLSSLSRGDDSHGCGATSASAVEVLAEALAVAADEAPLLLVSDSFALNGALRRRCVPQAAASARIAILSATGGETTGPESAFTVCVEHATSRARFMEIILTLDVAGDAHNLPLRWLYRAASGSLLVAAILIVEYADAGSTGQTPGEIHESALRSAAQVLTSGTIERIARLGPPQPSSLMPPVIVAPRQSNLEELRQPLFTAAISGSREKAAELAWRLATTSHPVAHRDGRAALLLLRSLERELQPAMVVDTLQRSISELSASEPSELSNVEVALHALTCWSIRDEGLASQLNEIARRLPKGGFHTHFSRLLIAQLLRMRAEESSEHHALSFLARRGILSAGEDWARLQARSITLLSRGQYSRARSTASAALKLLPYSDAAESRKRSSIALAISMNRLGLSSPVRMLRNAGIDSARADVSQLWEMGLASIRSGDSRLGDICQQRLLEVAESRDMAWSAHARIYAASLLSLRRGAGSAERALARVLWPGTNGEALPRGCEGLWAIRSRRMFGERKLAELAEENGLFERSLDSIDAHLLMLSLGKEGLRQVGNVDHLTRPACTLDPLSSGWIHTVTGVCG